MNRQQTILTRDKRRLARCRRTARTVIDAMRAGAVLHLHLERGGPVWTLSDGSAITDEAARLVTAHVEIIACGDALFSGASAQTYRFSKG